MIKRFLLVIIASLLLFVGFGALTLLGPGTSFTANKYYLYIKTGMNYDQVLDLLQQDTVVKYPTVFKWVSSRVDYPQNVKAGKYEIKKGTDLLSIVRMLRNGKQTPVNLVITKFRTKEDLASYIGKKLECDSASFAEFLDNNDSLKRYGLDTNTAMTAIFPNTYTYFWNTNPSRIFKKMEAEYKAFWTEDRVQQARNQGLDRSSAYILASIVEEETGRQDDKGKIASVYLNRMAKGMKLAADPTVKFALRNFELKRIYDKYLLVESPYNTYKYEGLPPGPICTPSRETIDAVLTAPKTDYLYFVAKPDFSGYSNFAANFKEHLQYAKEYQKALNEQMRIGQLSQKN